MGDVTSIGQDPATAAQYELVTAIKTVRKFGDGLQQEGTNGQEFLFHCPICIDDDGKGPGHKPHLRVSRATTAGRSLPFVGCRIHESTEDYRRIRQALLAAGVPAALLGAKGQRRSETASGEETTGGSVSETGMASVRNAEFTSRPEGLGERYPIPQGRIQRWNAALWEDTPHARRALEYLESRRLPKEVIVAAEFGLAKNKIILPIRGIDGRVVAARFRSIRKDGVAPWRPYPHPTLKKEDGRTPQTYGAPTRLYGVREISQEIEREEVGDDGLPRPVWITAGEIDRLTLTAAGCLSAAPTNGEGSLPRLEDVVLLVGREVIIVFDCDKAGRRGARKLATALMKIGVESIRVVDLDPERNDGYDVNDFFTKYDKPGEFDAMQLLSDKAALTPPFEPDEQFEITDFGLSERGMAEYVAAKHASGLKLAVPSMTWLLWDGRRWKEYAHKDNAPATNAIVKEAREIRAAYPPQPDAEDDPNKSVYNWANQFLNTGHRSVREHMAAIDALRVPLSALDTLPVLNTPNGLLDLATGAVAPHRPDALCRWITRGSYYDKEQRRTLPIEERRMFATWNKFIRRALPEDELRRYVQVLLGYSLLDGNPQRLLIFAKGPTSTGKSAFANAVTTALGSYAGPFNMSMMRDNQDEKPRADIVEALSQRVIFASETSSAWYLHADAIKRLTGGDEIKARLLHSNNYLAKIPSFTPWIMTNEVPSITAADLALDRRLVVIPFDQVVAYADEDFTMIEQLRRKGSDAVISWAVDGLRRWLRSKNRDQLGFNMPVSSVEAKFEFSSQLSPIHLFLDEMCERADASDVDYRVPVPDLYAAYEMWCAVNGIRDAVSKIEFGKRLSGVGIGTFIRESVRFRTGVRLKKGGIRV